ncbi:hypothetical protein NECHADRAFT_85215 [Paecilomyces variotii No. 5]|uniref:Rhodopsin domain-containing protein n=1 Tax=Byssochlamys spectabilis (strain No. 5 / NBRC 109023) TaxID=1356009 RepID=V5FC37_BYSSN|nr:hypothetical protein NECHADRAFT_85215 [Paecilomyces variotii No. 5]
MPSTSLEALLSAPALTPPDNVPPNFDDPPNNNDLAWGVTTACMVIATMCFLLRGYTRCWLEKKVRVEEVLLVCAYGAYWGTAYAGYALIWSPGYYVHTWNLRNKDLIKPLYLILVYGCCYSTVLPLLKTAILLDWCRIFAPINKCVPHEAIWKFYLPSKCYSLPKVMLTSASVQVITDISMVCLPQKLIWNLHMNWQKKLGISVIFGVGIIASIAACFRLADTVTFAKEADTMYSIGPLLFWACAEMTCGFFILSVPCIPKLIVESGLSRRIKAYLGVSNLSRDASSTNGPHSRSHKLSKSERSREFHNITRETNVHNPKSERSESQERLRDGYLELGKSDVRVTRTMEITVTSDPHSSSDIEESAMPWSK